MAMIAEQQRLLEAEARSAHWRRIMADKLKQMFEAGRKRVKE